MTWNIVQSDCIAFLDSLDPDSVDLVFGSPPYEEARLYLENGQNLGVSRPTEEWVAWMVQVYTAAQRVCKGVVAFVVAGQTDDYRWSAGPALLASDLCRAGFNLRNPPIYHRDGIPGSGGPDWWRSCYEWIICTSRPGKLPWSDNTATGKPPKYKPGGAMSYRNAEGVRKNARGYSGDGKPKSKRQQARDAGVKLGVTTSGVDANGTCTVPTYVPPEKANPGNVIYEASDFIHCDVGGGKMGEGDAFAARSEAPFPEELVTPFVLCFSPPDGTVCDPFSGSGTTGAVSIRHGRNFLGCDLRQSQVDLALRRLAEETPLALFTD